MKSTIFKTFVFCNDNQKDNKTSAEVAQTEASDDFNYVVEQFADIRILRYQNPGWEKLTLKEQELVYYLTQSGLEGRDIIYDQNYRHNLKIRRALENVYATYEGDKNSDDWKNFETYLKQIWFANGIHHHYSKDKIKPNFSEDYLNTLLSETNTTLTGEAFDVIFNDKDAKQVDLTRGGDNALLSAVNFYAPNITNKDVQAYYATKRSPDPERPLALDRKR